MSAHPHHPLPTVFGRPCIDLLVFCLLLLLLLVTAPRLEVYSRIYPDTPRKPGAQSMTSLPGSAAAESKTR